MAGGVRIIDRDFGYAETLKRLQAAAAAMTVGIHPAEGDVPKQTRKPKTARREDFPEQATLARNPKTGRFMKLPPKKPQPKGSTATLLEIATFHEFGLGVPRRSFIADWADENRSNHEAQLRKVAYAVVQGKVADWETGIARLGNLWVAEVQKRIADGISPALAQSTIDAKGSDVPLIDTGQLRSAIRWHIKLDGKKASASPEPGEFNFDFSLPSGGSGE